MIAKDEEFARAIAALLRNPERLCAMSQAARAYALTCSWDAVFDRVYMAYRPLLERAERERAAWAWEACVRVAFTGSTTDSSPG